MTTTRLQALAEDDERRWTITEIHVKDVVGWARHLTLIFDALERFGVEAAQSVSPESSALALGLARVALADVGQLERELTELVGELTHLSQEDENA